MRTLVLGGYGNFGARICRVLAADAGISLLVAGRDGERARRLADTLGNGAEGMSADCNAPDFGQTLVALGVRLVIHAAGPFQQQSYSVAHAAARAGAHYIDLADGRRFVCDFPQALQEAFLRAGRTGISGASTVKVFDGFYPGSPPFSRTLTRRPIGADRSVHVEAKEVQCGVHVMTQ